MSSNEPSLPLQKPKQSEHFKARVRFNRGGIHMRKMTNYLDGRHQLQQKFKQFNKQQICKSAKNNFLSIFGKHNPINYNKKFGFKQQWQMISTQQESSQYKSHHVYTAFSVIRMLLLGFCIWSLSTSLFFNIENRLSINIILLILLSMEIIKFILTLKYYSTSQKISQIIQLIVAFVYGLCMFMLNENEIQSFQSRIVGILIIIQMYLRLSKIYNSLKNYHISSHHRDSINLFDLFAFLVAITHIFGCVLYSTCQLSPQQNWVINAEINDKVWVDKYIYSLYFSATTLLTVGYGDLAPSNVPEVVAILITQFIGIAIFGYTVNKIGAALSKMQERSQKVQKDLGAVEKFGKNCRLQPDVICKMRTQVINNKQLDQDLCVKDENQLLKKFSEDLREKIQIQSCTKVIKRSIFMIINWTGSFQYKIARKLIKQVYKAQQILPQNNGKQKLYILDKGKIDVLSQSKLNCFQKVIKSIIVQKQSEMVVQNIYGYSAVISSRPLNLSAIARQTSICYTLSKVDFLKILAQCQEDKQHYHEIKAKIDIAKIPQQLQFPSIANIRHHYLPSVHFIISKYKNQIKKQQNVRTNSQRNNKKMPMTVSDIKQSNLRNRYSQLALSSARQCEKQKSRSKRIQQSKASVISTDQNYQIQKTKSYQRFFKKSNIENVILKLKTINLFKNEIRNKQN